MAHQLGLTTASKIMNISESLALKELRESLRGSAWIAIRNKIIVDVAELDAVLSALDNSPPTADEMLVRRDKVYPPIEVSGTSDLPRVFLYGDLEKPDFYTWHKTLKSMADEGRCTYIFRHFFKERRAQKVQLSGYGVELALKSTEYKAMDDSAVENATSESPNQPADVEEAAVVRGFNFTQLHRLHPELTKELRELQSHLVATDNQIRPLKAWQISNLDMQTSQMIMWHVTKPNQSLLSDIRHSRQQQLVHPGLAALQDISQNFPVRAGHLVSVQVDTALTDEVANNQEILGQIGLNPGNSVMLINGLLVSPSVDIFALLDLLRKEMRIMVKLKKLGVPGDDLSELLIAASDPNQQQNAMSGDLPGSRYSLSGRFAIDLATAPVVYVNDLEINTAYSNWPESLRSLFTPDFSGGIRRLRRNVNNLVLVVDPASPTCWQMIRLAESFLLHKTAIRIGFLWSFEPRTDSVSLLLARLFHLISKAVRSERDSPIPASNSGLGFPGKMAALSFLTDLYAKASSYSDRDGQLSVEAVMKRFEALFPDIDIDDFAGMEFGSNQDDPDIQEQLTHLRRMGLTALASDQPLVLFNGVILDTAGVNKMGGFEYAVINLCMEQLTHLQTALYHGQMSSGDSVFDLYKKNGLLLPRFNFRILSTQDARYLDFDRPQAAHANAHVSTDFLKEMRYFQKGDMESALRPVTIWVVVGDLSAVHSKSPTNRASLLRDLELAIAALAYFRSPQSSKDVRLGFVFNPLTPTGASAGWLSRLLHLLGYATSEPVTTVASTRGDDNRSEGLSHKFVNQLAGRNLANRLLNAAYEALNANRAFDSDLESYASSQVDVVALKAALQQLEPTAFLERHANACRAVIGLKPGERAVVVNGRLIGPLAADEEFTVDDFKLAERMAVEEGARKLGNYLSDTLGYDSEDQLTTVSELTWRVASVLGEAAARSGSSDSANGASQSPNRASIEGILSRNRIRLDGLSLAHSGFVVPGKPDLPTLNLVAVVDPCSRHAQRLSHLLVVLHQTFSCRISVYLNPKKTTGDLPIKNFYRFVWEPSLFAPSESGAEDSNDLADRALVPRAQFHHLPGQPLLTLGLDAPHGWMVAAVQAVHDLDNLRLDDIHSNSVEAVFDLEYLLLEGHASQETSVTPPRGLQLTLGPASDLTRHDTIVMANLGYFQLKANPGAWYLGIRSGKSRALYTISSYEEAEQPADTVSVLTTIDTFRSNIVSLQVRKRPERMNENLLDEDYGGAGGDDDEYPLQQAASKRGTSVWAWVDKHLSSFSNYAEKLCPTWLTSLRKSMTKHLHWSTCADPQQTINVFSLASGHLYERLLRIMMLTVIRHTKSPVKFWFLKNYLSPTFKDFIPHMAAEYGFQYELVQYQWPRWLNAQTEKQRIIWGYKILFLDVLFPLNVTKIIYVDADQIVRTDLQELANLDLEGAPYGYTPFCDSRSEMDGFRFWKKGYWAAHLAGRPYHISALYVVDLARFRQLAAGDRLRGQYHGLSHDPNSLSNLDQDLPNNMIHQVPIKSLPQEWLWCETWCSDESKERAKTIDLCNNPMTKEPKLSAAMRIAPEWVKYDQEIKRLWRRTYPPATSPATTEATTSKAHASLPPLVPSSEKPADKRDMKTEL